jgi:hypothetical protein
MTHNAGMIEPRVLLGDGPPGNVERRSQHDGNEAGRSIRMRLMELEDENLRLQRLVAELLIKNQKLRELLCEQGGLKS